MLSTVHPLIVLSDEIYVLAPRSIFDTGAETLQKKIAQEIPPVISILTNIDKGVKAVPKFQTSQ